MHLRDTVRALPGRVNVSAVSQSKLAN